MRLLKWDKKYDWAAITCGLGHLNMNQLKTYFAVGKLLCLDILAQDVLNV